MAAFSVMTSQRSGRVFAWRGSPAEAKKHFGKLSFLGTIEAEDEESAISAWLGGQ